MNNKRQHVRDIYISLSQVKNASAISDLLVIIDDLVEYSSKEEEVLEEVKEILEREGIEYEM